MDEEFSVEELKAALRKGVIDCKINPVFVGSAYKNKGVQELLDAVVDYLPAPGDVPAIKGTNPKTGEEDTREADPKGPFSALAFKIMTDPFVGKLTYLRVYSGKLDSGSYVVNATKDKNERIGRLLQMHSNQRVDIDTCAAGDIVAVVGLKNTTTGDTLCSEDAPIILESMEFADPVIDIAVEPKTKAEQDKMSLALQKLAEEDPTFRVSTNHETGQTIIAGMGASTAMRSSTCTRRKLARAICSRTRSSAALFPRNTSPLSTRASRKRCILAFWLATRSRTFASSSSTVLTTKSTPPKPPSRLLALWPSRTLCASLTRSSLSLSWLSKSKLPTSTPASSWATSRAAAA